MMLTTATIVARRGRARRCAGMMVAEVGLAMSIAAFLMGAVFMTQVQVGRLNACQLARQRCIAAGQAQLDSVAAAGRPIDADRLAKLWLGVTVEVRRSPGKGDWAGLTHVAVTASAPVEQELTVTVDLARYVAANKEDQP